jgi:hypothetical protein
VRRIGEQDGGVLAKTLALLLIVALLGAGAMYVYGKRQQPLSVESATLRATDTGTGTVLLAPDGHVYVATVVRNDGTFPVTLLGLDDTPAPHNQPYVASSIGLGDGKTASPDAAAAFTSVALKPGVGVGIFVVYEPNPGLTCANDTNATPFAPIPLRFSTFGVESTQAIEIPGAPDVAGFTRAECEQALGG